jgi:hypothetical protein
VAGEVGAVVMGAVATGAVAMVGVVMGGGAMVVAGGAAIKTVAGAGVETGAVVRMAAGVGPAEIAEGAAVPMAAEVEIAAEREVAAGQGMDAADREVEAGQGMDVADLVEGAAGQFHEVVLAAVTVGIGWVVRLEAALAAVRVLAVKAAVGGRGRRQRWQIVRTYEHGSLWLPCGQPQAHWPRQSRASRTVAR